MSISKCVVRLKDSHDTEHSVEVFAESLYEAVLRGLSRLQIVGWENNTNETINSLLKNPPFICNFNLRKLVLMKEGKGDE
jgi:hypothetical protein